MGDFNLDNDLHIWNCHLNISFLFHKAVLYFPLGLFQNFLTFQLLILLLTIFVGFWRQFDIGVGISGRWVLSTSFWSGVGAMLGTRLRR